MLDPTFRRRRRSITAKLYRVNRDLARHDMCDAAQLVPADAGTEVRRPALGRRALAALRTRLLEDLAELDAAWDWNRQAREQGNTPGLVRE